VRTVVIVQARMTSTRLPGKILADVAGRPMLAQELTRLQAMAEASEVMVATTVLSTDDAVAELALGLGVRCFRGDEHDVLGRYEGAARDARADIVVRITADCPLIDAGEADRVVRALRDAPGGADYASNVMRRTFPRGLDVEALHRDVLDRTVRLATSRPGREHVTWFIREERPDLFERRSVTADTDDSDLQWSVDRPDDLERVRALFAALDLAAHPLPYADVVAHVRASGN
jgi:spore coat polysaccharide biosynthesis protein SpsF